MSILRSSTARSTVARLLSGATALVLIIVVARISLAMVLVSSDPITALKLNPALPAALASQAYDDISSSPSRAGTERAILATRAALNRDPMSATAAANLGLALDIKGDRTTAIKLIDYSEALSRRNLVTQLWLIEYWVSKGDVPRTLFHYDVAMRTSRAAPGLLFPVLVSATNDAALIAPLAQVLAKQPEWSSQFIQQLVQSGVNLPNIAQLFVDLKRSGKPAADRALATLIDRLIAVESYDAASRLYLTYRPSVTSLGIRDGEFVLARPEPTAFDWNFPEAEGLSADIRDGALHVDAAPATGGVVARQLVRLLPGAHLIRGQSMGFTEVGENAPYLTLKCVGSGLEAGRVMLESSDKPQRIDWSFAVPTGCTAQLLEVVLQPVDAAGGVSGQIDRLILAR
ncbi:hypothetical protein [Sphingomonas oligophenolica]|uniref:hypothetical protein n=1 Tax=Sphingomonas oligophenolica TaxID=301154 RepID=UPI001F503A29|nr:hypothetical protein [Sphingomonas oligophenolica]